MIVAGRVRDHDCLGRLLDRGGQAESLLVGGQASLFGDPDRVGAARQEDVERAGGQQNETRALARLEGLRSGAARKRAHDVAAAEDPQETDPAIGEGDAPGPEIGSPVVLRVYLRSLAILVHQVEPRPQAHRMAATLPLPDGLAILSSRAREFPSPDSADPPPGRK